MHELFHRYKDIILLDFIREARVEDCNDCIILLKQLGYHLESHEFKVKLELCDNSSDYKIFVMILDNKLVGLIAITLTHFLHCKGKYAKIAALVVDCEMRGGGIGSNLLRYVENYALACGCDKIELTSIFHRSAGGTHQFYLNHGYLDNATQYFVKILN